MSYINSNWFIALAFCFIFFVAGRQLADVPVRGNSKKVFIAILLAFGLPSVLFPLSFFPTPLTDMPWYCNLLSVNRIEIASSLIAPFAGYITANTSDGKYYQSNKLTPMRIMKPIAFPLSLLWVSLFFLKPLVLPLPKDTTFQNNWVSNTLMQSVLSGSGPASLASVMHQLNGFEAVEQELIRGTYTHANGTENWYLSRYAVANGFRCRFRNVPDIGDAPVPSLLRIKISNTSQYIALMEKEGELLTIGDPLRGKTRLSIEEFSARYDYSGFVLQVYTESEAYASDSAGEAAASLP